VVFARFSSKSPMPDRTSIPRQSPDRALLSTSPADLPQSCLVTSQCLQIHGAFLGVYLPQVHTAASSSPKISTGWLHTAYECSNTDKLLSDAFSALSLQCLRRNDDTANEMRSQMLRGRVLRNLSRRLDSGPQALEDTTLACVMVLNFAEVRLQPMTMSSLLISVKSQRASSKGASGWLFHAHGASALVEARGTKNYESDFGRQLFLGSRLMNVSHNTRLRDFC
jgi:hypothetical protein